MVDKSSRIDPSDLWAHATLGVSEILLHRFSDLPDHKLHDPTCWCEPLYLSAEQMTAGKRALQPLLDEFYAVH